MGEEREIKGKKGVMHNTAEKLVERAILVGIITQKQTEELANEYLDELEFLATTAGAITLKKFTQKLEHPNPKTFVGSGKMQEIEYYVKENEIDMIIFDDDLTPSQIRNIEKLLEIKVVDRSNLILDIFASRARTAHAKTQVELAQYNYLLPRLTNMWTHLQKQKGGIGMKGPGEKEIETDRRIIRDKIALLKEDLKKIDKQKATQRGNRGQLIRTSLIGYTNVGKSTLMNVLCKSDVFAEDKLFATLDTTVRKMVLGNLPFLISDTVGFIRKLPHDLIESFKSTLDEVRESDLLIHVIDVSHPSFENHIEVVNETLMDIEAIGKPTIMIFNKIDNYSYTPQDEDDLTEPTRENLSLEHWMNTYIARENTKCIFISAQEKINIEELRELMYDEVKTLHVERYPHNNFLF
jgi:GTP-binding protein HflX